MLDEVKRLFFLKQIEIWSFNVNSSYTVNRWDRVTKRGKEFNYLIMVCEQTCGSLK